MRRTLRTDARPSEGEEMIGDDPIGPKEHERPMWKWTAKIAAQAITVAPSEMSQAGKALT